MEISLQVFKGFLYRFRITYLKKWILGTGILTKNIEKLRFYYFLFIVILNSYIHTYIYTYMHAYINIYIHSYTHTYIHTYIHT